MHLLYRTQWRKPNGRLTYRYVLHGKAPRVLHALAAEVRPRHAATR